MKNLTIFKILNLLLLIFLISNSNLFAQNWAAVGSGTNNDVNAIVEYNGYVVMAGNFTSAGGSAADHIAQWNGTAWLPLGAGLNAEVYALAVYNGNLIAAGHFTNAGGTGGDRIAKWNGTA